jgi:hypothetical protein
VDLPTILLILSAISIGATVIAVLVALRSAREARTAIFPIVKEEEHTRARRARVSILVWLAITAILLGAWLASLQLTNTESDVADEDSTLPAETSVVEFATQPPAETPLPAEVADTSSAESSEDTSSVNEQTTDPTATSAPATPTPAPAAVDPTDTPTPVPPPTQTRVPLGPAPDNAELGPIEFATEISSSPIAAVNPGNTFATDVKVFAVYPYRGMENSTTFTSVWYLNDSELARDESQWEWGWQGNSYSFFLPPGAGTYKLELYVNDTLLTSGSFVVR